MDSLNQQQQKIESILQDACAQLSDERLYTILAGTGDYKIRTIEALREGKYKKLTLSDFLAILRETDKLKELVQPTLVTIEDVEVDTTDVELYLKIKDAEKKRKTATMKILEAAGVMSRAKFYTIKSFDDFKAFMTLKKIEDMKKLVDANLL
jgi:hypothetical protein